MKSILPRGPTSARLEIHASRSRHVMWWRRRYCTADDMCSSGNAPNAFVAECNGALVRCTLRMCDAILASARVHGFGVATNTCPRESVHVEQVVRKRILPAQIGERERLRLRNAVSANICAPEFRARYSADALRRGRRVSIGYVRGSTIQTCFTVRGTSPKYHPDTPVFRGLAPAGGAQLLVAPDAPAYVGPAAEPPIA